MSTTDIKTTILKVTKNFHLIPQRFFRNSLQLTEHCYLSRDGHIHIVKGKKTHAYTVETFFIHNDLEKDDVSQAMDSLEDLLLIIKALEGKLKARDIISCRNAEIRRYLLEQFDYEKFVTEVKGNVIHRDGSCELIRIDWRKDEEPIMLVKVQDSTTRAKYLLRVPPSMRRCREAIAWTFDMTEEEYHPMKET